MSAKEKYQLEYTINSSAHVLYNYISSPSALQEWFADLVNEKNGYYIFEWDGSEERAKLITKRPKEFIKWQWEVDEEEGVGFEEMEEPKFLVEQVDCGWDAFKDCGCCC